MQATPIFNKHKQPVSSWNVAY